jgi:VWFA-related protein
VDVRGLAGFFEAEKAGGAIALGEEASGAERVAEDTGGFSVRNSNDLAAGLGRIAEGARTYYLLGYAPSSPGKPGRFRRIRVSVKTPGLTVRARPGYYP